MATPPKLMTRLALNESRLEQGALNEQIILRLQNNFDILSSLIPAINNNSTTTAGAFPVPSPFVAVTVGATTLTPTVPTTLSFTASGASTVSLTGAVINIATSAVTTVATDGVTPTGPYSVAGSGSIVFVEGSNVTMSAAQPSAGIVEITVNSSGGGGGTSNIFKLSAAQLDSGSVSETTGFSGRLAANLLFTQINISNTPASYRRCLPHPGGTVTTYDPLVWSGTPPTGWTGNVIVRLFGWVGSGSVTSGTTFVRFYARMQVQDHGEAITTFYDGSAGTTDILPTAQNVFFHSEVTAALPTSAPTTGCTVVVECGRQVGDAAGAAITNDFSGNVFVEGVEIEFEV